ncbi:sigma-B regulation protein RsbU (phosphoserine phosphatase) [Granulicella pectinivorans]|jgi:sigma-B regulation protein RsbU (phosphoserine phosphatase)|uniref:Sigma-B regulation protein RsbU (Phosphoserine phosphatase) n=1 Tax=Granulicella pectinivorans TaxID=474950 RepID=A0A1I6LQ81_9BACT|nr:SpoIIE family protein phosphatase [Granulicella pectinivorans]SFS05412.1 sigma-B regulation protein RsbU (phosphoserine phosphatase) [Granulicella pectinivorans]
MQADIPIHRRFSTRRLKDWTKQKLRPAIYDRYLFFTELGEETSHIVDLASLMRKIPARFATGLRLTSLTIFLREEAGSYCVRHQQGEMNTPDVRFSEKSSTVSHLRRTQRPAPIARDYSTPWLFLADRADISALQILGAQLVVPFVGRRGLPGFAVIRRRPDQPFGPMEIRLLQRFGHQMGQALEAALTLEALVAEGRKSERMTRELELAREVQEHLLPRTLPSLPRISVSGRCQSAERVGGDYFDVFVTEGGKLCCAIGDVSGKGIPSALLMATLRACLRSLMLQPDVSLIEVMRRLNGLIYESSSASKYATFFLALLQPETNEMTYVNGGHNPPLLMEAGKVRRLTTGGPVLGLFPVAEYESETLILEPGATLAAYTDGFSEAEDASGEEWGERGLLFSLNSDATQPPATQMLNAFAAVERFAQGAPQHDDMTLLLVHHDN